MRSHKSDALLHRINHDKEGILGGPLRKSILLPDRMVQSQKRRVHPDGGGYASYVSDFHTLFPLRNCMLYLDQCSIFLKKKKKHALNLKHQIYVTFTNVERSIDAYL